MSNVAAAGNIVIISVALKVGQNQSSSYGTMHLVLPILAKCVTASVPFQSGSALPHSR